MPTATVDLGALSQNVTLLRRRLAPATQMLAAVKADAYGHGAPRVAQHLERVGVNWFGVATPDEALELRAAGIEGHVLIFSPVYEGLERLIDHKVALTVVDEVSLERVQWAARAVRKEAHVHLKVDTGMGRLGLPWREAAGVARAAGRTSGVVLEGVWTHFACADEAERGFTEKQIARFKCFLDALRKDSLEPAFVHAANSAALIAYPETHFDMVRPGIALYGYHSSDVTTALEPGLKPVMTLTAPVTFVKRVRAGESVSYGAGWTAPEDTTVATLRIGYADGYPRGLSGRAEVLVGGVKRPVVGRICMDQMMVDVGGLEVRPSDRVTLFGPGALGAEGVARLVGSISYELLTGLGSRITRRYA